MDKNRFSRQLIVLRAVINGYSGHARLIHSGDSADLEVRIQSPADSAPLSAVLVEKTDSGYRSALLGALDMDDRGQTSGSFSMAQADITPDIIAIVQQDADCKLAMSGFLNGPRSVNWADVRAAACDAVHIPTPLPAAVAQLPDAPDENKTTSHAVPDSAAAPQTAAEAAGVSPDAVWPQEIESLQEMFESQTAVQAYPGSRYTFVRVYATDDQPEYLAGLRCAHGIPMRVVYAVPGDDPYICPQGLESFTWRSGGDGSGYWMSCIDAATGQPIDDDY